MPSCTVPGRTDIRAIATGSEAPVPRGCTGAHGNTETNCNHGSDGNTFTHSPCGPHSDPIADSCGGPGPDTSPNFGRCGDSSADTDDRTASPNGRAAVAAGPKL